MIQKISFLSDGYRIEGLLESLDGDKGVVIAHPHPLYGGNMFNPVVETISRAYGEKGFTTLRFNFRGAGASQGRYDHGHGEKNDIISAVGYLKELGLSCIDLAGYSFGAWVQAGVEAECGNESRMVMISPPMAFLDFRGIRPSPSLRLIVVGQEDEIAPVASIREWMAGMENRIHMEMIAAADHFFSGRLAELESILLDRL